MRSLLLCDRSFAQREHAMLRRLEVGLVDEGVIVTRAVPESCLKLFEGGLSQGIGYADSGWRLTRSLRAATIVQQLRTDAGTTTDTLRRTPVDVIHAWGESSWGIATDLAAELGSALMLEVWSRHALSLVRSTEHASRRLEEAGCRVEWIAPDALMAAALRDMEPRWGVREVAWGVHVPTEVRSASPGVDHTPAVCVVCRQDADAAPVRGLFEALASDSVPELMIFMDSAVIDAQPELWRTADRLGLLDRLSVLDTIELHRDLLLKAEALILPDPGGEHRSIMLDAMAHELAVVTRADPLIEDAIDGRTAITLKHADATSWRSALLSALDPAHRATLGRSAREYVAGHRLAHHHVRGVIDAYSAVAPQPIAFAGDET